MLGSAWNEKRRRIAQFIRAQSPRSKSMDGETPLTITDWESLTAEVVTDRRRGKRVNLRFPVEISGLNHDGKSFCEHTHTTNISASGCRAELNEVVERGDLVSIKLVVRSDPGLVVCQAQQFRIVWRERRNNVWTVGALKLTAEQLWHVAFPDKPPLKHS